MRQTRADNRERGAWRLPGVTGGVTLLCLLAAALASLVAAAFISALHALWGGLQGLALLPILPALSGLLAGLYTTYIDASVAGSGVRRVLQYVLGQRRPAPWAWAGKWVVSLLCMGSGSSGGVDGPSMDFGYGLGHQLARTVGLKRADCGLVGTCAAVAALGAVLQTPIGAAVFVLEAFYRRILDYRILLPAVLANCVGYSLSITIFGLDPRFGVEGFAPTLGTMAEAGISGLAVACLGVVFVRFFKRSYVFFRRLRLPRPLKPLLGAGLAGGICWSISTVPGVRVEEVLGPCLPPLQYVFESRLALIALSATLLVRVLATTLVVTSRNSAGLITPVMLFGALGGEMLAALLGHSEETLAIAGIAAALAAVFNAPLGAIFIVVEMTHLNYTGPVTLAAYIGYAVASRANILVYRGSDTLQWPRDEQGGGGDASGGEAIAARRPPD